MAVSWISSTIERVKKSGSSGFAILLPVVFGKTTKESSVVSEDFSLGNLERLLRREGPLRRYRCAVFVADLPGCLQLLHCHNRIILADTMIFIAPVRAFPLSCQDARGTGISAARTELCISHARSPLPGQARSRTNSSRYVPGRRRHLPSSETLFTQPIASPPAVSPHGRPLVHGSGHRLARFAPAPFQPH